MKNSTCLVCETVFLGRNNQKFCGPECKNNYYNQKNRLRYQVNKHQDAAIAILQDESNSNKVRSLNAIRVFDQLEADFNAELAQLKADYTDLLNKYMELKDDLETIRSKYWKSYGSAQKTAMQIENIKVLYGLIEPYLKKVEDNLGKTNK
jgi:archaellum component FlaC